MPRNDSSSEKDGLTDSAFHFPGLSIEFKSSNPRIKDRVDASDLTRNISTVDDSSVKQ
jgi:hypothetical protein